MIQIGVVGAGFVGGAVRDAFKLHYPVKVYDIDPAKASHSFEETVNCDFVFIALPTPMISAEGGKANLNILFSFFEKLSPLAAKNNSVYIIKSTVPVGTTRHIYNTYNIKGIVHNPEFLRAKSALQDFLHPSRNIVGRIEEAPANQLEDLLLRMYRNVPCLKMQAEESELVKYAANSFLATKVIFFNEIRLLVDKLGLDWDNIVEGVTSDERIGKSHSQVPGHDFSRGVGGTCVLPDAKVNVLLHGDKHHNTINISDLYTMLNLKKIQNIQIESCNATLSTLEDKNILDITRRKIDENIYVFHTDSGEFSCTSEHLMPIKRNRKTIMISAKDIKETDKLYIK